jgi:hypothetical protein
MCGHGGHDRARGRRARQADANANHGKGCANSVPLLGRPPKQLVVDPVLPHFFNALDLYRCCGHRHYCLW